MSSKLDDNFNFHSTALALRAQRQQLLASNIANSDTPGYQARDFDFATALQAATGGAAPASAVLRTNAMHLDASGAAGGAAGGVAVQYRTPTQAALDNNSVDVDVERAQFVDNTVRYEASLRFLNQQIKTMLAAIQS